MACNTLANTNYFGRWSFTIVEHTHTEADIGTEEYEYHSTEQLEELKRNPTHTHGVFKRKC